MNGPVLAIVVIALLILLLVLAGLIRRTGWAIRHAAKAEQLGVLAHARMNVRDDPELPAVAEPVPTPVERPVTFLRQYGRNITSTAAAVAIGVGAALLLISSEEAAMEDASPAVPISPSPTEPPGTPPPTGPAVPPSSSSPPTSTVTVTVTAPPAIPEEVTAHGEYVGVPVAARSQPAPSTEPSSSEPPTTVSGTPAAGAEPCLLEVAGCPVVEMLAEPGGP